MRVQIGRTIRQDKKNFEWQIKMISIGRHTLKDNEWNNSKKDWKWLNDSSMWMTQIWRKEDIKIKFVMYNRGK